MAASDVEWKDVTADIQSATQELGKSSFIMDDGFSLRECMNALELGDPKMDNGMGSQASMVSAADELASGKLSLDVSTDELLDISDTLLRLQVR